ncbi:MAG: amidohydrolase family protein [Gemmatimonadetes bacterium]|nr:amidohydrolase family protein [Gemmatimonadota bacterium]
MPRALLLRLAAAAAVAAPLGAQITPGAPKPADAYVIRNATIVPVTGPRITGGSVVLSKGRIAAVGASVDTPPGATVIDGTGMFVYPGLIDSGTRLGLTEIGSVPGGDDLVEVGPFNPHDVALTAVNPHSEHIAVSRYNGITSVLTAPTGGIIAGTASLIDLSGWTGDQMAVKRQAALVVNYPRIGGGRGGRGGRFGGEALDPAIAVTELHEYFARAKAYSDVKTKLAAGQPGTQRTDLAMEAMVPFVRGELPVVFDAETAAQIRGALGLADEFKLKPVIRGAAEAWRLADTLAARKVPVVVGPTYREPDASSAYDEIYANPGVLVKAGVQIAFQTTGASDVRDLPFQVGITEGFGLAPDDALRAVTINAARIWGVGDQLGSIETGKVANLFVSTGDPMDPRSHVKYLFIRGEQVPLVDRQTKFYEEFRARPKPPKP